MYQRPQTVTLLLSDTSGSVPSQGNIKTLRLLPSKKQSAETGTVRRLTSEIQSSTTKIIMKLQPVCL